MLIKLLKRCPTKLLVLLKTIFRKKKDLVELFDSVRLERYTEQTDLLDLDVHDRPICLIQHAEWDYPLFNVCFLENMIKNIVYCLANGYRPVVNYESTVTKTNLWESLFVQPYGKGDEKTDYCSVCDVKAAPVYFPAFPTDADVKKYGKLYKAFVRPNPQVLEYWEEEYRRVFGVEEKAKRVLGVLCRGTDYVATKPKGHPIQPKVEDVIELVKRKNEELQCEYIYLATEEEAIYKKFEAAFPGKILINKRKYFDSYYTLQADDVSKVISSVHFDREDDNYLKALEYFSSLNLLSKCSALIAGSCGGSRAALYMNNGKHEYSYLFNLGVY